jgi:hypothetical protein
LIANVGTDDRRRTTEGQHQSDYTKPLFHIFSPKGSVDRISRQRHLHSMGLSVT